MVSISTVGRPAARVDAEPLFHCSTMNTICQPFRGRKGRFCSTIGDKLDGPEEAAAADIANIRMIAEPFLKR